MRVACEAEGTLGTCSPGLALEPHSGSCLPPAFVTCQLCQAQFPAQPGICTQSSHDPRCLQTPCGCHGTAVLQHHHTQGRALSPGPQTPFSLYTSQMEVKPRPLQGSHAAMLVLRLPIVSLTAT